MILQLKPTLNLKPEDKQVLASGLGLPQLEGLGAVREGQRRHTFVS